MKEPKKLEKEGEQQQQQRKMKNMRGVITIRGRSGLLWFSREPHKDGSSSTILFFEDGGREGCFGDQSDSHKRWLGTLHLCEKVTTYQKY